MADLSYRSAGKCGRIEASQCLPGALYLVCEPSMKVFHDIVSTRFSSIDRLLSLQVIRSSHCHSLDASTPCKQLLFHSVGFDLHLCRQVGTDRGWPVSEHRCTISRQCILNGGVSSYRFYSFLKHREITIALLRGQVIRKLPLLLARYFLFFIPMASIACRCSCCCDDNDCDSQWDCCSCC